MRVIWPPTCTSSNVPHTIPLQPCEQLSLWISSKTDLQHSGPTWNTHGKFPVLENTQQPFEKRDWMDSWSTSFLLSAHLPPEVCTMCQSQQHDPHRDRWFGHRARWNGEYGSLCVCYTMCLSVFISYKMHFVTDTLKKDQNPDWWCWCHLLSCGEYM